MLSLDNNREAICIKNNIINSVNNIAKNQKDLGREFEQYNQNIELNDSINILLMIKIPDTELNIYLKYKHTNIYNKYFITIEGYKDNNDDKNEHSVEDYRKYLYKTNCKAIYIVERDAIKNIDHIFLLVQYHEKDIRVHKQQLSLAKQIKILQNYISDNDNINNDSINELTKELEKLMKYDNLVDKYLDKICATTMLSHNIEEYIIYDNHF